MHDTHSQLVNHKSHRTYNVLSGQHVRCAKLQVKRANQWGGCPRTPLYVYDETQILTDSGRYWIDDSGENKGGFVLRHKRIHCSRHWRVENPSTKAFVLCPTDRPCWLAASSCFSIGHSAPCSADRRRWRCREDAFWNGGGDKGIQNVYYLYKKNVCRRSFNCRLIL